MTRISPNHAKNQVQGPHRQQKAHIRVSSAGGKQAIEWGGWKSHHPLGSQV